MIQQSIDTQVVIKEIETGRGLNKGTPIKEKLNKIQGD